MHSDREKVGQCYSAHRKRGTIRCVDLGWNDIKIQFCIKCSAPHLFDTVNNVGKSHSQDCSSHHKFSNCATQKNFHFTSPVLLPFQLVKMTSRSYPSNDVVPLGAMAGANPIPVESLSFPNHQSASSLYSAAFQTAALATTLSSFNDVGAPMVTPATKPNGWATKQHWARHQAIIKQLYSIEKKPLAEVMRLMEILHGFRATSVPHTILLVPLSLTSRRVKMYKMHIKQWGLDRNNKEFEMRAIVRKNKQRADQGKGSIIRVRGQVRNFAEVVRYWDRKGVSIEDIIARQTASPTPEAVEFSTPIPSPILTPEELAIPERILRCIREYFKSAFESGTWIKTAPLETCYSITGGKYATSDIRELFSQCLSACTLFSMNSFEEAGQILIAAAAKIKKILSAEAPETLLGLLLLISSIHRRKRHEVALIILRQFSALGKVLLGSEHPLRRICEWVQISSLSDFDDIAVRCMESMENQFASFLGPMHRSTLDARRQYRLQNSESNASISDLSKLLGDCEETLGPHDDRSLGMRMGLASAYFAENFFVEARKLSEETVAYSQCETMGRKIFYQIQGLLMLAKCQYALGEVQLGISNLHKAVELVVSTWGPQDSDASYLLVYLEQWYREQGDWSSAAQIRDRRVKTLELVDMD